MLVHYYREVGADFDEVLQRLGEAGDRFDEWALAAHRRGEMLQMRVGPGGALTKRVVFTMSEPANAGDSRVFPVAWHPVGAGSLFPSLDAEIVVAPVGDGVTQLSFEGRYEPPFDGVGDLLHRAGFHRIAQSTVRDFVDRMGTWIENGT